jgi:phenylpropionate dioxygenase-like ring-hydroxylating dioxygenase large terminal subunit
VGAVQGLHASRYTHADFARLEREQLLKSWQFACHVSDLPAAGTALRFDFAGRTGVLLRGRDGGIRAFINVCRHRGSRIVDGDPRTGLAFCVHGRLRCPYHAWEYDDLGSLVHVPHEETYPGLDRSALGLPELPVETWLGLVFVAFEPPARSIAEMLEPVRPELEASRLEALRRLGEPRVQRYQADWKLVCQHRLDTYHLAVARPLLKPRVGGRIGIETRGDDVLRLSAQICAAGTATWSARAYDRWLPESIELPKDRRRLWASYFVWPNLAISVSPDMVAVTRVMPAQPGQSLLRSVTYALPDASREMRIARYLNQRIARRAGDDDRRVVERAQRGIATGDATQGPIASDETGLSWFVERMRRAVPAPKTRRTRAIRARGKPD